MPLPRHRVREERIQHCAGISMHLQVTRSVWYLPLALMLVVNFYISMSPSAQHHFNVVVIATIIGCLTKFIRDVTALFLSPRTDVGYDTLPFHRRSSFTNDLNQVFLIGSFTESSSRKRKKKKKKVLARQEAYLPLWVNNDRWHQ